ncbi:MAG: hypothetical protein FWC60_04580 [Firmicutes bacterium]|nr:hypothetical protein [Bacillota bacterium]
MHVFRLLIINGLETMRNVWSALFSSRSDFAIVGELDKLNDFNILISLQPDVVLIGLKNQEDSIATMISNIKELCPWTLVIVFTDLEENANILPVLAAGADGYLKNPILPVDLVGAIELTCRSGVCFFPRSMKALLNKQ